MHGKVFCPCDTVCSCFLISLYIYRVLCFLSQTFPLLLPMLCQYRMSLFLCWKSLFLWNVASPLAIMQSHPTHVLGLQRGKILFSHSAFIVVQSECHYAVAASARKESWSREVEGGKADGPLHARTTASHSVGPPLLLSQCNSFFCC